jgi:hypothetical protein
MPESVHCYYKLRWMNSKNKKKFIDELKAIGKSNAEVKADYKYGWSPSWPQEIRKLEKRLDDTVSNPGEGLSDTILD